MFTPYNQHLEVEPALPTGIIQTANTVYDESGKVLSIAEDCERKWEIGSTVFFDQWLVARFTDTEGKTRYLVPESAIRAYEPIKIPE